MMKQKMIKLGLIGTFFLPILLQAQNDWKEDLQNKTFVVEVHEISPRTSPSIVDTYAYYLELRNDSVFSNLPYIGKVTCDDYAVDEKGIYLRVPYQKYKEKKKKQSTTITFIAHQHKEIYSCRLKIDHFGNTQIKISMLHKEPIRYKGRISKKKKKEK